MPSIYGIDLGTSNCQVAIVSSAFGEFDVECLTDEEGNFSFPSVVSFPSEDQVIIGERALELLPHKPDQTIELVKVRLGKYDNLSIRLDGQTIDYSPIEVASIILRHFNYLHDDMIEKALLTVPAYFNDDQKTATKQAGDLAGIEIVELIEEPSAAAMYYLFDLYKRNPGHELFQIDKKNILVFDFGGGTLDLSLVGIEKVNQEVKPVVLLKGGDSDLGGNTIDFEFSSWIIESLLETDGSSFLEQVKKGFDYYRSNYRFQPNLSDEVKNFILRLKTTLEDTKKKLSFSKGEPVNFGRLDIDDLYVTRNEFEDEVLRSGSITGRIESALDDLMKRNVKNYPVHQVILIGGSSQIPLIKRILKNKYPGIKNNISIANSYDQAVAMGAAITGAITAGKSIPPFGFNRLYNVTSHDIYVLNAHERNLLIENSTPYPFEEPVNKVIRIGHSLDTKINLKIKEEYELYDQNIGKRKKQESEVCDINFYHPCFYTGDELEVQLDIDEYGLFKFTAKHVDSGEEIDFEAEKPFALEEDDLLKAKKRVSTIFEES